MNEKDRKTLVSIIGHIELIKEYMKNIESVHAFEEQPIVRDAVVFNLLQIGKFLKRNLTDDTWQSER